MRPLLAVALLLLVAACSSTPRTAVNPAASVEPSARPSAPPSAEPTPVIEPTEPSEPPVDSVPIPSNAYARVVADDLRVRSQPRISDDSKKLKPLLQRGALLVVLDGPVQASGYDWYQVQPTLSLEDAITYPAGWVAAASREGEAWIEPDHIDCPPEPADVLGLESILEHDEMYWEIPCFSGRDLTFEARLGRAEVTCVDIESDWIWEPGWFGSCVAPPFFLAPVEEDPNGTTYWAAFPPGIDTSIAVARDAPRDEWPIVEVTGMFDHPLAQTCHNVAAFETAYEEEPDPYQTVMHCRRQFVVTSMHKADR
jgi:hypothetical protein